MRKYLAYIIAALVLLALLFPAVQDALLSFLAAGIIPGTSFSVPPLIMISLSGCGLAAMLFLGHREARKINLPPIEISQQPKTAKKKRARKP